MRAQSRYIGAPSGREDIYQGNLYFGSQTLDTIVKNTSLTYTNSNFGNNILGSEVWILHGHLQTNEGNLRILW